MSFPDEFFLRRVEYDCVLRRDVFTPFKNKVEGRSEVRQLLPTPGKGDLPLPAGGLPCLASAFDPQTVEELNAVVPDGAPKLQTAHPPQVHAASCGHAPSCGHAGATPSRTSCTALPIP